ncbi:fatty acid cis/trans isomerase [Variovorax saccharolyticus]|uniref:fatty acid cis/trans isomerase n=1 Tax=Variovorax saccharolyticus TaxID=3053516 RepID=UPI0025769323|nr:fatty acid cis/trans isomerase [Variovorax sp. J31P216]MDM0028614.1 fatty acid cis/trans isomerase [Variovorax sp. J31P216]
MRRVASLILVLVLAACTTIALHRFDQLYGPADPRRFDQPLAPPPGESYAQTIQPILDRRCVACHACYDAPCQLKATAWEGLARGASKTPVYDATRLLAAQPTRLFVDAQKPSEWRELGFFPVLNEHAPTPEANRAAGLMHRLLMQKEKHPLPTSGIVGGGLDFSIDREAMCPAGAQIDEYERKMPLGGMPFGLPGLSPAELGVLSRWIERGAPYEGPAPVTPLALQRIAMWERFFNGDTPKERLFSRYAFEHLFLAHLYFDDDPERQYFRMVRSTTPPGQPVALIASRRPVDDPGVERFYYRLVPERETIVAKTHMPYALGATRMARWRSLFLDAPYTVDRLPGYSADTAANPFATFAALPVDARYRFMLDEAEYTIMGFIKGPVCRGQMALDVIDDRFWVTFLSPSVGDHREQADLLARDANLLRLPTGSSNEQVITPWLHYAKLENEYLSVKSEFLARGLGGPQNLDLRLVWDGDGRNPNAALTVFRHFDSASVVKGLVGEPPKTAWVIGYPLLERIHYLLVANYDVFGNIGHQLNSRLYMDFLRMEGEFNFLVLLPQAQRIATRDYWYRADSASTREQVYGGPSTTLPIDSGIRYRTADARLELLGMLKTRLAPVLAKDFELDRAPAAWRAPLRALGEVRGASLEWLPEDAALVVEAPGAAPATFSLLRNTGHASVSQLIGERRELRPDENTLTLVPGIIGAYPNAFYRVSPAQLPAMTEALRGLKSEADYAAFSERYAVRRTNPDFWSVSDGLVERYRRDQPLQAGILDLNRFENR